MSYYGIVFPEFWTGRTGRELKARGKDAQLLALYLATNRHANMLGLYRLPLDDVRHETGLSAKAMARAFTAAAALDYAHYDAGTWYVWVQQMARIRLGLKVGEAMNPEDLKVKATNRIYGALDPNPFLGEFFDANRKMLGLKKRRESVGLVVALVDDPQMSGFYRPLEAPLKPVTGSGIRKQDQVQAAAAPPSPSADPVENPNLATHQQLVKLAHIVIAEHPDEQDPGELLEHLKKKAATKELLFTNSGEVARALDSALYQHRSVRPRAS